jgi:TRAP-type C4-dicarboxylate transport system permease small subunit
MALILLIVADVILRYFFNAPIFGARDLAKLLLVAMIALATAYSARSGGQVAIEVFSRFLGQRGLWTINIGVRGGAAIMLAILAWRLTASGLSAGRFGERSLTLDIPYAPFYFLLACGMALYSLVLLVEISLLLQGEEIDPGLIDGEHS